MSRKAASAARSTSQTRKPLDLALHGLRLARGRLHRALQEIRSLPHRRWSSCTTRITISALLVAGIYQERHIRRDGFEILGYAPLSSPSPAAPIRTLVPTLINSALFQQDRIRKGGNFDMQFKPNDQLEFNLNGFLSIFDAENTNQSCLVDPQRAIGNGGSLSNCVVDQRHLRGRHGHLGQRRHFGFRRSSTIRSIASQSTTSHDIDLDTRSTPRRRTGTSIWISATRMPRARPIRSTSRNSARRPPSATTSETAPRRCTMLPNATGKTVNLDESQLLRLRFRQR